MIKQFLAKIKSKKLIAENTHEIIFDTSQADFNFIAGQYITVTIPSLSALPIREQFRDFSIVSSPNDSQEIAIAFRDSDSPFKQALLNTSFDCEVEIEGPKGIFYLPKETDSNIVFIAGGIGVAPFISMIRATAENKTAHQIFLFYYNATKERTAYLAELTELASSTRNFSMVSAIGLMNAFEVARYLTTHATQSSLWFIAGPPGMVSSARKIVRQGGAADDTIKTEEFTGYA